MVEQLGIEFVDIGDDSLVAQMPVDSRTKQVLGILHGGANVALAESLASTAANRVIDPERFVCVGLEINANHIRSVREGKVEGVAKPLHLGRSTHVWEIHITHQQKLTCISRMTLSVLEKPKA